jgi:hypothetical protein
MQTRQWLQGRLNSRTNVGSVLDSALFNLGRSRERKAASRSLLEMLRRAFRNAQMLSLSSLAAILCSAMRLSRAAFLRSPLGSKVLINVQKNETNMGKNMATNIAINRAASMSVSYEKSTPSRLGRDIPALSSPKIQSAQVFEHYQNVGSGLRLTAALAIHYWKSRFPSAPLRAGSRARKKALEMTKSKQPTTNNVCLIDCALQLGI